MSQDLIKRSNKRAWLVLVGCCCLQMAGLGTVLNSSAAFFAVVPDALGLSMGSFALWIAMYAIAAVLILPVIGNLFPKYDTRILMTVATLVCGICVGMFSMASELWHFLVLGFVLGLSGGSIFLYPAPVLIGNWFETKKGLMTGIAMTFSGIGGAIFPIIFTALMPKIGWQGAYIFNAAVVLVMILPFTIFVFRFKPADVGLVPYGYSEGNSEASAEDASKVPGISVKTAIKSIAFLLTLVACGFMAFYGGYNSYMIAFAMSVGQTAVFGASLMTALQLGYIISTPLAGALADKIGAKGTGVILVVVMILCFLSFITLHSAVALMVTAFFFGSNNSLVTVVGPLFVREIFGGKDYARIYSYASMAVGLVGGLGATIVGSFYDKTGNYSAGFMAGIVAAVVILVFMFMAASSGKRLEWEK